MASTFNFYAWADPQMAQFTPVMWTTGVHEVAQFIAAQTAGQMMHKAPSQRPLLVVPAMDQIATSDHVDLIATGRNIAKHTQWYNIYFQQLAARNCRPTFIGVDEEWGFSTFDIFHGLTTDADRIAAMRRFYDNSAVRAKMPASVTQYTPEDYVANGWSNPFTSPQHVAWNDWAAAYQDRLLRKVVYEPARHAWPGITVFGNYNVWKPGFEVRDMFGWPAYNTNVTGSSCPTLYLLDGRFFGNRAKDPKWNLLIRTINMVRSGLLAGRKVVPWISHPSYDGTGTSQPRMMWLWKMLVEHCAAAGVTSFIYWNPVTLATADDNALAALTIDQIRKSPPRLVSANEIDEIDFDVDQITTGDLTTTYGDFVDNFLNV